MQPDDLTIQLIRAAVGMAGKKRIGHLVWVSDAPIPPALVKPGVKRKVISVVSTTRRARAEEAQDERAVLTPRYEMGRQERFRLALVAAHARGYVREREIVVGLVGRAPQDYPDTLMLARVDRNIAELTEGSSVAVGAAEVEEVPASVFDAVVDLAVHLGVEGWEGHAVGTMFVLGDSQRVMEKSRQLAMNPFQGYSEAERDIGDPMVQSALRAFATLDGGFIVREDGIVLAAGRYLEFPPRDDVKVPLGLGARHVAAAMTTAETDAVAVVVSQSTGKVRVFRGGKIVLELTPRHRRT